MLKCRYLIKEINTEVLFMFKITDECLSCGTCAAGCPQEAIAMGEIHYEIDQEKCIQCGTCKENCPADAIVEE